MVKNLELSKKSFRQEIPLILVIDKPVLPLKIDRVSKIKGIVFGAVLFSILTSVLLVTRKILTVILD